ncbi:MAG TPA: hypothetical protein DCE71_01430 [Parachlamydiales bacterium]|nr:hypothetical protein [Parachlamydiales bacterium]
MMKPIILLLTAASFLYGSSAELIDNSFNDTLTSPLPSQEIASLEMPSLLQSTVSSQEITLPEPLKPVSQKKPWIAVSLSTLFPGLGHLYLGDHQTASAFIGTTSVGFGLLSGNVIHRPAGVMTTVATLQATSFYGIYAAYRDARLHNGSFQYSYQMPTDNLADLTFAPFKWTVLKKPQVWGGILGFLALGSALTHYAYPDEAKIHTQSASTSVPSIVALPVGLGEEAFFRGYLQSALSEALNPTAGTILSSIIFAAAHQANAQGFPSAERWRYYAFSMPFIAAVGAYCGWMTHTTHSLQQSVALHTWYDFILFSVGALADNAMITGHPGFAFSMPF